MWRTQKTWGEKIERMLKMFEAYVHGNTLKAVVKN